MQLAAQSQMCSAATDLCCLWHALEISESNGVEGFIKHCQPCLFFNVASYPPLSELSMMLTDLGLKTIEVFMINYNETTRIFLFFLTLIMLLLFITGITYCNHLMFARMHQGQRRVPSHSTPAEVIRILQPLMPCAHRYAGSAFGNIQAVKQTAFLL